MSYLIFMPFFMGIMPTCPYSLSPLSFLLSPLFLFSGIMKPGLNAIMGPTGSGKTRYVS